MHTYFKYIHQFSIHARNMEPGTITSRSGEHQTWHCPNDGCLREFRSIACLRRHNQNELCTYQIKETSMDQVKRIYADKLDVTNESVVRVSQSPDVQLDEHLKDNLSEGWALKNRKLGKRFSKLMLQWVKAYFMSGENTGKKLRVHTSHLSIMGT